MNKKPFFSIITVTYNAESSLQKTIKSVVSQTFNDYEYIIIDGNSSDKTQKIINSNKKSINSWISEKDKGIYDAMNKGLEMAKGEYIYFLNSADTFHNKNVLLEIKKHLDKTNASLIYGDISATRNGRKTNTVIKRKISQLKLKLGRKLIHQSLFVKTKLLKAVGGFDLRYNLCADYDILCKLSNAKTDMQYIPLNIANFELTGASSNIKETYRENYQIIHNSFGILWAFFYKLTSTVRYFISSVLSALLPISKVDRLRRFSL